MVMNFSCSMCVKLTGDKEDSLYCDKCNLNYVDYKYLSGNGDPRFFLKCYS